MFTFRVKPVPTEDGGPGGDDFTVVADSRDVVKWERAGRPEEQRSVSRFLAEVTLAAAYPMAYIAAKRQGLIDCTAKAFEDGYLIVLGSEPAPDPTRPEA